MPRITDPLWRQKQIMSLLEDGLTYDVPTVGKMIGISDNGARSVLFRMHKKGLLSRNKEGDRYFYFATKKQVEAFNKSTDPNYQPTAVEQYMNSTANTLMGRFSRGEFM